jgi:hypothetical protein
MVSQRQVTITNTRQLSRADQRFQVISSQSRFRIQDEEQFINSQSAQTHPRTKIDPRAPLLSSLSIFQIQQRAQYISNMSGQTHLAI